MRRREFIALISGGEAWVLAPHDSTAPVLRPDTADRAVERTCGD